MDEIYGLESKSEYSDKALMSPENMILPVDYQGLLDSGDFRNRIPVFGSDDLLSAASALSEAEAASISPKIRRQEDANSLIKAKIASHPYYLRLLEAYIDCQKVGAPPEIAAVLEEIRRENDLSKREDTSTCGEVDPSLDEFMETYCEMLVKYKSDLERPFGEATSFLNEIEEQLSNLTIGPSVRSISGCELERNVEQMEETYCEMLVKYKSDLERPFGEATSFLNEIEEQLSNLTIGPSVRSISDGGFGSSDDELSVGNGEFQETQTRGEGKDLKDRLFRRFGSHISNLKQEFSKKKKKGKLPKEAKQVLLEWWNVHYKWPYPTEADKVSLAEVTGLDPKQINNWFINQRKRHWKPTEGMHFEAMEILSGRILYG